MSDLRRFVKKVLLFGAPFGLFVLMVFLVDPFEYFNVVHLVSGEMKREVARVVHDPLWNWVHFKQSPMRKVMLGDSRAKVMSNEMIKAKTGEEVFNFSYGGGAFDETVETFWLLGDSYKLDKVYVGLNFDRYIAEGAKHVRVVEADRISTNCGDYVFSRYALKSAYLLMTTGVFGDAGSLQKPEMSREEFWENQMMNVTYGYKKYKYPESHWQELSKMAEFADKNGIELVFFVPPTHVALQRRIEDFGLEGERERFLGDLKKLGDVYDFDWPSEFAKDRDNFTDPYHVREERVEIVIEELFGGGGENVKVYQRG